MKHLIAILTAMVASQRSPPHHARQLANDDIVIYSVPTSFQAHPGRVVAVTSDGTFEILRTDYNARGRKVRLRLGGILVPPSVRREAMMFMRKNALGRNVSFVPGRREQNGFVGGVSLNPVVHGVGDISASLIVWGLAKPIPPYNYSIAHALETAQYNHLGIWGRRRGK